MLILSVMISTMGSSLAMGSPSFLSHLPTVPSTTLSPSCGTTIVTGIPSSESELVRDGFADRLRDPVRIG